MNRVDSPIYNCSRISVCEVVWSLHPVRHRPAREHRHLGQRRQGDLGHAQAQGQPRLHHHRRHRQQPVRPRRSVCDAHRDRQAEEDRVQAADARRRGQLLPVSRDVDEVVHLLSRQDGPQPVQESPGAHPPGRSPVRIGKDQFRNH